MNKIRIFTCINPYIFFNKSCGQKFQKIKNKNWWFIHQFLFFYLIRKDKFADIRTRKTFLLIEMTYNDNNPLKNIKIEAIRNVNCQITQTIIDIMI